MNPESFSLIKKLVGNIEEQQLQYVDGFIHQRMIVFMPVAGPCFYAQSPNHSHPSYMFVLRFNDSTSLLYKGEQLKIEKNKVMALAPGVEHQEICDEDVPRYLAFFIDKNYFEAQYAIYSFKPITWKLFSFNQPDDLHWLAKKFMAEVGFPLPGNNQMLESITNAITHSFIRSILDIKVQQPKLTERVEINRAIEFIQDNLERNIVISDIAEKACMSVPHFNRIFKAETNQTPGDFLANSRFTKVKKLLQTQNHTITDIAQMCGFRSAAYLSSAFIKKYKMSPTAFQQSFKN